MINQKAVALKYKKEQQNAPKVIAKGSGEIAKKILQKAQEFNIPIFENEALVNSLMDVDLDKEIPPLLYQAAAEVFVWLLKSEQNSQISKKQR
ncbi:MAG: EscU/YscU/HrcU family type III secretion system export apparatus switch protein [Campylobacterales bacterium]|nr:EscU/YscU/HrcU family type III secretion system export apparatus switch protein [Campylobacterales bacterium]